MSDVTIPRSEVLSLIGCAEDYGHTNAVLMDAFAGWLGPVSDEEIDTHARSVADEDGYGEEDYDEIKERLVDWRERFEWEEQG